MPSSNRDFYIALIFVTERKSRGGPPPVSRRASGARAAAHRGPRGARGAGATLDTLSAGMASRAASLSVKERLGCEASGHAFSCASSVPRRTSARCRERPRNATATNRTALDGRCPIVTVQSPRDLWSRLLNLALLGCSSRPGLMATGFLDGPFQRQESPEERGLPILLRFDSHSRACHLSGSGGRQKPSGRRREFSGKSIHRHAQSALTCPFHFAGFHHNKP
jgi:hypothetical protein